MGAHECLLTQSYSDYHLSHGTIRQAGEGGLHIFESEYPVDHRTFSDCSQARDHFLPRSSCGLRRIVCYGDTAHAISAKKEGRGVELGHRTAASADDADGSSITQQCHNLIEQRGPHVIHGDIHLLWTDCGTDLLAELGVRRIEDEIGAKFFERGSFFGAAGKRDDAQSHRLAEQERGDAYSA